jgi:hypothetical protein
LGCINKLKGWSKNLKCNKKKGRVTKGSGGIAN